MISRLPPASQFGWKSPASESVEIPLLPSPRKENPPLAVGGSAALFGLAHWAGGWSYVLLAALAGLGYALAFRASGRIEMAILAHFGLNAVHFLLLTYPGLAV